MHASPAPSNTTLAACCLLLLRDDALVNEMESPKR